MNEDVFTNLEQVTAEWLTAVLTRSGALIQGGGVGFAVDTGQGNWSTAAS